MADITLREIEEFPVLMIRKRTSLDGLKEVIGDGFMKIATYLEYLGESPAGPPYVAYYNNEMDDLDIEIGFPVVSPLPGQGAIHGSFIKAHTAVECLHKGPYSKFPEVYGEMMKWMEIQDLSPVGAYYETYLNSPGDTPEAELLTMIRIAVK